MFGAVAASLVAAAPASAAGLLAKTVTAASAVQRSCTAQRLTSGGGYAQQAVTSPVASRIVARLQAASGDWDVAVFDATGGRVVAGSANRGSDEVAAGFASQGERLVVQACRVSGGSATAALTVTNTPLDLSAAPTASLVRVSTPNQERRNQLTTLGLDLTEHAGPGFVDAVVHGARDADKLRAANFVYTTDVADLDAQSRNDRQADLAFAAANDTSSLPDGRTTYRRLFDYSGEMKRLAREHPDLVRPITLAHTTYEGRPVEGIEIATNPNARDGRPVFLQMGVHHAREWPSGEHAMEWAYELILGYRRGDPRATRLVQNVRTIVVPIVNPDGFDASREAGELYMNGGGAGTDLDGNGEVDDVEFIAAAAATHPNEYRRKNCRLLGDATTGTCLQPSIGLYEPGVDPNRNYGGFWGGPGADTNPLSQSYRGSGPFSEPESQNIRELISSHQVTTLITNHTFSNLVLRPPGIQQQGPTPDEPIYKALGDAMAAQNGYSSQFGYQLYDTTGTTEDWSYFATGGLGFTFEIGKLGFHPPFADVIAHWNGTNAGATGGGNREAYYLAEENAADPARHSVIAGRAPAGAVLRLGKTFQTPMFDGSTFTDTLDSTMVVPADGAFEWHTNPSTRPLVAQERGREATGGPSPQQQFQSTGETTPCANFDDPPAGCYEDHLVTVPSGAGIDNAKMTVRVEWATPVSDYDLKVYRAGADGKPAGEPLSTSGQSTTSFEQVALADPAGDYVVRVINYAGVEPWTGTATFEGPDPHQAGEEETWTLYCEQPEGVIRSARQLFVGRGERRSVDLRSDCRVRR
jgi:hypothetical protein